MLKQILYFITEVTTSVIVGLLYIGLLLTITSL